ncbi:hypothetical protein [Shewanella surugensis]|uniref:Uncharacterized protein n=1 Tax=Shewanella surugensis TaxID=212020 RepID=A0ABT0LHT1_9GAMM|nr:hypothetical protein [Shewanella surugensis]MCL1126867.1 hypothetical protein [Shewanella surugensis]
MNAVEDVLARTVTLCMGVDAVCWVSGFGKSAYVTTSFTINKKRIA